MMHVTALVFQGTKTAGKALDTFQEEVPEARLWIDDVAVVSRGKHGMVRVNSTWASNDELTATGAGFGAITGALLGAAMGPGGALAGGLGGASLFGLMGIAVDIAADDPRLDEFASQLKDDTSALVLVADEPITANFRAALADFEGEIIETKLNEHDVKALREHLKANRDRG